MLDSRGCRVFVLVALVAIIVGTLGFATGFVTHTVMVEAASDEPGIIDLDSSSAEASLEKTLEPTRESTAGSIPTPEQEEAFELFWEAWELIEEDFYGDIPEDEDVMYGAIRGAVNTLDDPYTAFIEPDFAAISREDMSGSFEGIGATVTMRDGRLEIVAPIKDQPAEKAGLRRGDIVLEVDGTSIEDMSLYEAITLIRGPADTEVRLKILREGEEPFEVTITRDRIEIPVVEWEMREDGVAYVSLFEFSNEASDRLEDALKELLDQDPTGLILDLRGNPGGFLGEAVDVAGLFLPKGEVVLIERFKDGTDRTFEATRGPAAPDVPMVVLVDGGSASASEIVAGALQDTGRAVLIGETTLGKGSVQLPHELSDGAELRVTVARWFTPNDRAIHGEGLDPDIEVELTQEDVDAELDPQLERAVEYLLSGD